MTWYTGGHNNWLSMSNDGERFELKFNQPSVMSVSSFAEEAGKAALLMQEQWGNKPLYLALSGGIDSEFVAETLFNNNVPFIPVILKIEDLNKIESWYAEYWCYQHNITPVVLNYRLEQYEQELIKFFPRLVKLKNYTQAPILIIYDYVHRAGGHCIYAGGDINLSPARKEFYCNSLDFISNLIDVGNHPTSFFMYTPELALSYITSFNVELSEQYNKLALYKVPQRPKIDYANVLHEHPYLHTVRDKLHYMFAVDQNPHDANHWYGTKEQIIKDLTT